MTHRYVRIIQQAILALLIAGCPAFARAESSRPGPVAGEKTGPAPATPWQVQYREPLMLFSTPDPGVATVQLLIRDQEDHLLFDSGETAGQTAGWPEARWTSLPSGQEHARFELLAWDQDGNLILRQGGEISFSTTAADGPAVSLAYDTPGNYSIGGFLGIGISTPERAIHIRGGNAVFRMDRSRDTAAFMIVRTDTLNNPLKAYVVGVNASGTNQGSFVINDLGQSTSGSGVNRFTLENDGKAVFGKDVRATGFFTSSSRLLKTEIRPVEDPLGLVLQLHGVRFNWRETGEPSLGFIAEEVNEVVPELVTLDDRRQPAGVNYGLVSVLLVESVKAQQAQIDRLQTECVSLEAEIRAELALVKALRSSIRQK